MQRTREVFSWLAATKLPAKITRENIDAVAQEFIAGKPRLGWLIDGSSVVDYDSDVVDHIRIRLGALSRHGLRYVAFVHPNSLIRSVVLNVVVPGVVLRGFETARDAEGWFRKRCQ